MCVCCPCPEHRSPPERSYDAPNKRNPWDPAPDEASSCSMNHRTPTNGRIAKLFSPSINPYNRGQVTRTAKRRNPRRDMTPSELVAQRTWILLGRAKALRAPFGEESLTDLLVLEMFGHQRARGLSLQPTTKQQEASCGACPSRSRATWDGVAGQWADCLELGALSGVHSGR